MKRIASCLALALTLAVGTGSALPVTAVAEDEVTEADATSVETLAADEAEEAVADGAAVAGDEVATQDESVTEEETVTEEEGIALQSNDDSATDSSDAVVESVTMYRLYNSSMKEHLYTSSKREVGNCLVNGWKYEGIGWYAPSTSDNPVYRIYNPTSGKHLYTMDSNEVSVLVGRGWKDEGIGWYSDDDETTPIYRQYIKSNGGTHNYTGSTTERDTLVSNGWRDEGVAWYALSVPTGQSVKQASSITTTTGLKFDKSTSIIMYRLYNRVTGEHLYTSNVLEIGTTVINGWVYEGVGWVAPKSSDTPVYRLYNKSLKLHHYTTDLNEYNVLAAKHGWNQEGICWYSGGNEPVYRQYYKANGNHNYTGSITERDVLVNQQGWRDEGVAWYGVAVPKIKDVTNAWNDASYTEEMRQKAIKWGDEVTNRPTENGNSVNYNNDGVKAQATGWMCTVDIAKCRICVFKKVDSVWVLVNSFDCVLGTRTRSGGRSRTFSGVWTVHHKSERLYAKSPAEAVPSYWTCFCPAFRKSQASSSLFGSDFQLKYYEGWGYDEGQGFHGVDGKSTNYSTTGCTCTDNNKATKTNAKYIYDNVPVGSAVVVFDTATGDPY